MKKNEADDPFGTYGASDIFLLAIVGVLAFLLVTLALEWFF